MNERNPLGQAREAYESLRIPDELPDAVQDAVRQARREARRERSGNHFLRYAVCAAACLCVIFVVALNAVPVLAQEMYGVPVLGHMVRIFTLNRFEESSEESYVVVNVPALENTGNTEASGDVVMTDTFDPILQNLSVTYNGQPWTANTNYTYNTQTGAFATLAGQITVPAATATQDPATGLWSITPGTSTLRVTGTVS